MQTLAVPYHLADLIPDFDAGVDVDEEITLELPSAGPWQPMGVLYEAVARAVSSHDLPVMVLSGDCTTSLGVITGLQRAGREVGIGVIRPIANLQQGHLSLNSRPPQLSLIHISEPTRPY